MVNTLTHSKSSQRSDRYDDAAYLQNYAFSHYSVKSAADAAPENSVYEYSEITAPLYKNKIN